MEIPTLFKFDAKTGDTGIFRGVCAAPESCFHLLLSTRREQIRLSVTFLICSSVSPGREGALTHLRMFSDSSASVGKAKIRALRMEASTLLD